MIDEPGGFLLPALQLAILRSAMTIRANVAALLLASATVFAQKAEQENKVPAASDLNAITIRGRMLAEYDVAAWHATDVIQDMKPEKGSTRYYIAKKAGTGWIVVFGRLSEAHDKFLVVYEAEQGTKPGYFTAKRFDPPLEDSAFYLHAAIAFEAAL
jgi:hypothetical protein